MSINRPIAFTSSILLGLALFIYRQLGSKSLLHLLQNLAFCGSCKDVQMLELSATYHPKQPTSPAGTFTKYVFANADFNVSNIDGLNTFHSMGGGGYNL